MKIKQNKKQWTILGVILASVAIIPATAMIVTSCSNSNSNTNTTSSSTEFKASVSALGEYAKMIPSDLDGDKLTTFILSDVVSGYKGDITIDDIIINLRTEDLSAGSLTVKYLLTKIYVSGALQENNVENTVKINGLAIWNTTYVNTLSTPPTGFETYLPSEVKALSANNLIVQLQNYIYEKALTGHKEAIVAQQDIIINFANSVANDVAGTIELNYTVNKYWDVSILKTSPPLAKTVLISGLKKA